MNLQTNYRIEEIVEQVVKELQERLFLLVEASGRHVHLSAEAVTELFGSGYRLHPTKELSQPGQYACEERVTITGPKGELRNVVILGPVRKQCQVEVSMTDTLILGVKAPVRLSGDTAKSTGIKITNSNNGNEIVLKEGLIVAKRHIHMTPEDAKRYHVENGSLVKVKVIGERPVVFEGVDVRVSKDFRAAMHIDYDEANACGLKKTSRGIIIEAEEKRC